MMKKIIDSVQNPTAAYISFFFFTQVNQEVCVPQNELLDRCMRKTQQGKQACVPWLKSVW
jgi:hypothetical protein